MKTVNKNRIISLLFFINGLFCYSQNLPIVGFGDATNYRISTYSVPGSSGLDLHWHGGIRFGDRGGDSVMQITNGNIGIGTTNPSEKLEVYNSDNTPGVISLRSERNDFSFVDVGRISAKQVTTEIARIGMPRAGGTYTGYLTFWTKADNNGDLTEKVRINEIGNVGIGTTTPRGILELEKLNSNLLFDLNTNSICKIISKGWNANIDIHTFQINGIENQNQLYLNSNGNVGIGTTTSTSKLTVAGNIASREVKVTVDAGADFVFENDYNLPSLDYLNKFIKENKHLPEIASAEEMKKDGINLSEMNIKLLQKIEEMTLYMIEQNQQINDLKNRLEKVELQSK
ncbi:hypothetical protein [Flavobacterium sp. 2]|uniref:hypothetical protein n=1 Tax=Flavobacterium sp. 2 TaxID=308053 RepID=UPI003CEF32CC